MERRRSSRSGPQALDNCLETWQVGYQSGSTGHLYLNFKKVFFFFSWEGS